MPKPRSSKPAAQDNSAMVRMAFHIHKSARKGLKAKAQSTGLPVAEVLRRIIDDALKA